MQQTINLAPTAERNEALSLQRVTSQVKQFASDANKMLDSRSDFYSRLMEEDVTWRQALRAGVVLPLMMMVGIGCVATQPVVSLLCLAMATWVNRRINAADREASRRQKKR